MSDATVRLAVVSHSDDITFRASAVARVREADLTTTANSWEAVVNEADQFDAVIVRSSTQARGAIEAGKHVLVDAPVADSFEETKLLIEFAVQAGVVLAVSQLRRFDPSNRNILERLSGSKLGTPGLLRVHRWNSQRNRSLAATLFGDIDLALILFGAKPTDIYAVARSNHAYLQIHLGFSNGGMVILDYSERLPAGQGYKSLTLIGSRGAAYADDHNNTHLLFAGGNPTALISDSGNGHVLEIQDFVDRVARSAVPETAKESSVMDGEAILAVHQVIDAIRVSVDSAQVVRERGGLYEFA